jgi:hypothetical protein
MALASRSGDRPPISTLSPRATSNFASARPMPLLPPTMA